MKIREIMQKPIETLLPETPVKEALERMRALGVTSLPVQDRQGSFLGVVTPADLSHGVPSGKSEVAIPIKDRLSPAAVTATPEMDVGRLAEMMRFKHLDNIMVLEARRLVGTVSLERADAAEGRNQAGG
jgi:predicted transcriptional regulator